MTSIFLDGFKMMKDGKVIGEFTYYRRGNVYEIFNSHGNIFSKDSYTEAEERWNKILSYTEMWKMLGIETVNL